jgi:hypothetical protein
VLSLGPSWTISALFDALDAADKPTPHPGGAFHIPGHAIRLRMCILIGACAGSVFAGDAGRVGALIRGPEPSLLIEGAEPSFPGPDRGRGLSEPFRPTEDETSTS